MWVLFVFVAILNGAGRETFIRPHFTELVSHQISSLFIFLITYGLITTLGISKPSHFWLVGGLWLLLTIVFEYIFGHFIMKHPWSRLFADYNILKGRLWLLVLLTTTISPFIAAKLRGIMRNI